MMVTLDEIFNSHNKMRLTLPILKPLLFNLSIKLDQFSFHAKADMFTSISRNIECILSVCNDKCRESRALFLVTFITSLPPDITTEKVKAQVIKITTFILKKQLFFAKFNFFLRP